MSKSANNNNNNANSSISSNSNTNQNTNSEETTFESYFKTNYPWQGVYLAENVEKALEEVNIT